MSKKLTTSIVEYLNTNSNLISKLGKNRVFFLHTTDIKKPSLVYTIKPITGGIVRQSQLELKIIWKNPELILEIEDILDELLDFEDKDPTLLLNKEISLRSKRSGGGPLFNDNLQMYENSLIYIITWRCK